MVIVVVELVGAVITAVPGLPDEAAVQVPEPEPPIVAEPPGSSAHSTL